MFSILIAIFGSILRNTIISLITWIGFRTFANQYRKTLQVLFVSYFINSVLVLVLVNTNFENSRVPFVKHIFTGAYTDFSRDWYDKIGSIIITSQIIMIISTPIDCAVRIVTQSFKQYNETGNFFKNEIPEQRSKTVAEFVSNNSNPPFNLDFRYAYFIVYVYVPFLFGAGMPVLYPITLANIVVQYYLDRVMVAYFHS